MGKKNNEVTVKFNAQTENIRKEITKLNQDLVVTRSELRLNSEQLKGNDADSTLLQQKQEILGAAIEGCQKKIALQTEKLEKAKELYGENSAEVNRYTNDVIRTQTEQAKFQNQLNDVEQKLEQLDDSVEDAAEGYENLGNAAEDSGNKTEEAAGEYTVAKNVIADLTATAIQGAIDKFGELAIESEAAIDKLGAKIGASKQDMSEYKDVVQDVYKNGFGENIGEVTEALGVVVQLSDDLNQTDLSNVTQNVMTLSDVYDMDFAESMRGAQSLMDQFGISSDEAFNLIVQGAQNGLNQNEDLLDVINEYSVQFANSGLSANDMFNMIKNGADQGVWSIDKMGDAYKEFNIRMSDGTANDYLKQLGLDADEVVTQFQTGGDSAKGAMNQIAEAITNCDDATLQYQVGVGIMGTMWEDMGQDACLALLDTEGQINKTNDAMGNVKSDAYDNIKGDLAQMKAGFEGLGTSIAEDAEEPLRGIVQTVTEEVIPALENGSQWLSEHETLIVGIGVGLAALSAGITAYNVVAGIKAAMDATQTTSLIGLASAQLAANAAFLASPITWIVAGIVGLIAGIVLLWNNCEGFRDFVTGAWDGITNIFGTGVEKVKMGLSSMGDKISSVKETCGNALDGIKEKARTKLDETKGIYEEAGGGIAGVAAVGMNLVKSKYQSAYDDINTLTGGRLDGLKEVTMNKLSGIKTVYEQNGGGIKGIIAAGMSVQKEIYSTGYDAINQLTGGKLDKLKNKAKNTIDGAAGFFKTGIDKIKGLLDFDFKWPHVKVPSIGVTWNKEGTLAKAAQILGLAGMPKFNVTWNANGAIFTKPMIAGWYNGSWQGVGEAGAEAVLPIERLEDMIGNRMESFLENMPGIDYRRLAEAIVEADEGREIVMVWNDREMGRAIRRVMA